MKKIKLLKKALTLSIMITLTGNIFFQAIPVFAESPDVKNTASNSKDAKDDIPVAITKPEMTVKAEAYCDGNIAKISATAEYEVTKGINIAYSVNVGDHQSDTKGESKKLEQGKSVNWILNTNRNSLNDGEVGFKFEPQAPWFSTQDTPKAFKMYADYAGVTCVADDDDDDGDEDKDEVIIVNENVSLDLDVKNEEDNEWKQKEFVENQDDVVEIRAQIENTGDSDMDDVKLTINLPDELEKIDGNLTEYFEDFDVDEEETVKIKVKVKDEYFNPNVDKCVVVDSNVKVDGDQKVSDTITVCFGNGDITELPETGSHSLLLGLIGMITTGAGLYLKKYLLA